MKKKLLPEISLDKFTSILGLGIAVFALLISWRANYVSKQANNLATQANSIAQQQNEIALLAVSADVDATKGYRTDIVSIYTCKYNGSDTEYSYKITENTITFVNNGGLSTSLVSASLSAGSFDWNISIYEKGDTVELPIVIEPGTARVWTFVAKTQQPKDKSGGVWETDANGNHILLWNFEFSNGKVLTWITHLFPDVGIGTPTDCEYFDNLISRYK